MLFKIDLLSLNALIWSCHLHLSVMETFIFLHKSRMICGHAKQWTRHWQIKSSYLVQGFIRLLWCPTSLAFSVFYDLILFCSSENMINEENDGTQLRSWAGRDTRRTGGGRLEAPSLKALPRVTADWTWQHTWSPLCPNKANKFVLSVFFIMFITILILIVVIEFILMRICCIVYSRHWIHFLSTKQNKWKTDQKTIWILFVFSKKIPKTEVYLCPYL